MPRSGCQTVRRLSVQLQLVVPGLPRPDHIDLQMSLALGIRLESHDEDLAIIHREPQLTPIGGERGINDTATAQSCEGRRDSAEVGKRNGDHAREYAPMQGEVK